MSRVEHDPAAAVAVAKHWVIAQGVAVEHWPPPDPAAHVDLGRRPIIFLVEPGAEPPHLVDDLATWMQLPGDVTELHERAHTLLARARSSGTVLAYLDDECVLRVGKRLVILPPVEARIMRLLLDNVGAVVGRDAITAAVWPSMPTSGHARLNSRVKHLRDLLVDVPLRIHSVRSRGLLLEITPASNRLAPDVYAASGGG